MICPLLAAAVQQATQCECLRCSRCGGAGTMVPRTFTGAVAIACFLAVIADAGNEVNITKGNKWNHRFCRSTSRLTACGVPGKRLAPASHPRPSDVSGAHATLGQPMSPPLCARQSLFISCLNTTNRKRRSGRCGVVLFWCWVRPHCCKH